MFEAEGEGVRVYAEKFYDNLLPWRLVEEYIVPA